VITAQVEPFMANLEQLKPLLVEHWRELALDQDKVPLEPCWEIYAAREAEGGVLYVTVRDRGRLVGYFVGFVGPGLHYRTCLTLQMDVFWLHPEFRDGDSLTQVEAEMVAEILFSEVRRAASARGVQRLFVGSKLHKDASALFERMGFVEVERYYSAWLGG
jgi:GNAT superfamily N-acetyltransferase